jgi:hypothetical protein
MSIAKFDQWQNRNGTTYGTVLQGQFATSGFVNQSIASATPQQLSGMEVTITPYSDNSRFLITAMITGSWTYVASAYLYRNGLSVVNRTSGTNLQTGNTNGAMWTYYRGSLGTSANQVHSWPITYMDSPGVTAGSSIKYQIYANAGWSGGVSTFFLNNRDSQDMLGSSTISVWEIQT